MHVTGTSYRPDLDGVRAIAVVSVILYHFDFSWIAGGFAGVDIFFVLSGFFITSQIATQLERGDFSLANFYERRIRRIIPALLVMLFATTLAALVLLMPDELRRFCRSLIAATLSLSNIHFYRSSDYFAAPAQSEPLLHTWSLSVEEQFYLLFPIALMAAYRWLPRYCIHLTTAVLAVSFAFSVWAVSAQPMAAFYLLPSRAWELLLGSLLALNAFRTVDRLRLPLSAVGLALVVGSLLLLHKGVAFPGLAALPPCLGTALIVYSGLGRTEPSTVIHRMLAYRPVVFVGLLSYSLYLWHWPVLAFLKILLPGELSAGLKLSALSLVCLVSWLSWQLIERPIRSRSGIWSGRVIFQSSVVGCATALLLVASAALRSGLPQRFDPEVVQLAHASKDFSIHRKRCHHSGLSLAGVADACVLGDPNGYPITVLADSHGTELAAALAEGGKFRVRQLTTSGCSASGIAPKRPLCGQIIEGYLNELSKEPPTVIVVTAAFSYWNDERNWIGFERAIKKMREARHRVVIVGDTPIHFDTVSVPTTLARRANVGLEPDAYRFPAGQNAEQIDRRLADLARSNSADYIDARALLCPQLVCPASVNGIPLYFDGGHLSMFGVRWLIARSRINEVLLLAR